MKKLIVIALVVVMALSIAAFVACGPSGEVEGEYSYAHPYGVENQFYGVKVKVTVKNGVITALEVTPDTDTFYNLSDSWTSKQTWIDGEQAMIDSFVGLSVDEVNAIKVECAENGVPNANGISEAPSALKVVTGATQSSGRLILAVQNALSKLGK